MSRGGGMVPHYTDDNHHDTVTSMSVYLIAEMACSHDGRLEHARRIAQAAGRAGADALQLQIWRASDLMVPHHPDYARLCSLELSPADWRALIEETRRDFPAMDLQACVYDTHAVDFAHARGIDLLKIHAGEIGNESLLRHAARCARRIDLCIGACRLDEIQRAIAAIKSHGNAEIWLLYGIQTFPTPLEEVNLDYLKKLGELFELPIGYQDHSDAEDESAFWIPAAALGMGVGVLEKHLTDDRSRRGADHQAALEPDEFARFVKMVRAVERARGVATPQAFSERQRHYRTGGTRTLVAARELPAGTRLAESDLLALRSADGGVPVADLPGILGRELCQALLPYQAIRAEDIR